MDPKLLCYLHLLMVKLFVLLISILVTCTKATYSYSI